MIFVFFILHVKRAAYPQRFSFRRGGQRGPGENWLTSVHVKNGCWMEVVLVVVVEVVCGFMIDNYGMVQITEPLATVNPKRTKIFHKVVSSHVEDANDDFLADFWLRFDGRRVLIIVRHFQNCGQECSGTFVTCSG